MGDMGRARGGAGRAADGGLWPGSEYHAQVARLQAHIGQPVYLVELVLREIHLAIHYEGRAHTLLDVLPFPQPDASRRLYPHLLLLDDGRGINLGRLVRVSRERAFLPTADELLFEDNQSTRLLRREHTPLTTTPCQPISNGDH